MFFALILKQYSGIVRTMLIRCPLNLRRGGGRSVLAPKLNLEEDFAKYSLELKLACVYCMINDAILLLYRYCLLQ